MNSKFPHFLLIDRAHAPGLSNYNITQTRKKNYLHILTINHCVDILFPIRFCAGKCRISHLPAGWSWSGQFSKGIWVSPEKSVQYHTDSCSIMFVKYVRLIYNKIEQYSA